MAMTPWRRRKERALASAEVFRQTRRVLDEDVTVLGEQLAELHVDTLTDELDAAAREDYQHALGFYDRAKTLLRDTREGEDLDALLGIDTVVRDARFHRACVLARAHDEPLPTRREPCFFNPQHLPAVADVAWAPPAGVERQVAVCPACRSRLADGEAPDVRLVRMGDRYVPWWQAKDNRGAMAHAVGTAAFDAVPPGIRYEADIARMRNNGPPEGRRN